VLPCGVLEEHQRRYGRPAFAAVFVVVFGLFIVTIGPTIPAVLVGALLAALSAPLRDRLGRRIHSAPLCAALVTAILVGGVLAPLTLLGVAVVERLLAVLGDAPQWVAEAQRPDGALGSLARSMHLQRLIPENLGQQATALVSWAGKALPSVVGNVVQTGIAFFLVLVTTYYLLRDGKQILARLERILPLEPRYVHALVDEFGKTGRAVFVGMAGAAALQALAGGVVYWALGVPHPLLLGALTFVAAMTPLVGTSLVAVPVTLYLALSGGHVRALVALGAAIAISGLDNVVRPWLMGTGLRAHPLLLFLGIFGALPLFGPSGILLGPLFVSLFTAVGRIYAREFAPEAAGDIIGPPPSPRVSLSQQIARRLLRQTGDKKPPPG